MSKIILAFGEILWDLLPSGRTLGGAPFNFAYRACCLNDRGIIVSRLGRDELDLAARDRVVALGMETTFLQWDQQYPTGTVQVSFDADSNPDYYIVPDVAYDHAGVTDDLLELAGEADCLCFGTLAQRRPVARDSCRQLLEAADAAIKLLDLNLRKDCYSIDTISSSLEQANILKLNEQEAIQLADMLSMPGYKLEDFVKELISGQGLSCCVVTLDRRGAFATSSDGEEVYVPGYKVELADSLGAGDAFTAGFIHKYLARASLGECCEYGNAMGAVVASQEGGAVPLGESDVLELLESRGDRVFDPDKLPG